MSIVKLFLFSLFLIQTTESLNTPTEHLDYLTQMMLEHHELINWNDISEPPHIFLLKVEIKKIQHQLDKLKFDLDVEVNRHLEQKYRVIQSLRESEERINWLV